MKLIHFTDTSSKEHFVNPAHIVQLTKSEWCTGGFRFYIYIAGGEQSMYSASESEIDEETYKDIIQQLLAI